VADVDLLWIPLGSGQRIVRCSGRAYEALAAWRDHRPRCALHHAALVLHGAGAPVTVEMTPVPDGEGATRGVVVEGPVGSRSLGRWRVFRYEVRCWAGGVIPDAADATAVVPIGGAEVADALLAAAPDLPSLVWGRDEMRTGEMWNSNSVVAWLLVRAGIDAASIAPPAGARAPGWAAGVSVAGRPNPPELASGSGAMDPRSLTSSVRPCARPTRGGADRGSGSG
jgi:hypothetical protein